MIITRHDLTQRVIITMSIGIVSFCGDRILQSKNRVVRALFDNLTHAIVGGLSWTLILLLGKKYILRNVINIFACFLMSSLIDIDHFIEAGSWDIHDATNLDHRPFLHCTTLPVIIWTVLILISKSFEFPNLFSFAWMLLTSFLSHHIRDANRRGLWFCPFGSTRPIPYFGYLLISMSLPYVFQWLMSLQSIKNFNNFTYADIV